MRHTTDRLKAKLETAFRRVEDSSRDQFMHVAAQLAGLLESERGLRLLLDELCATHPEEENEIAARWEAYKNGDLAHFRTPAEHAAFCFQGWRWFQEEYGMRVFAENIIFDRKDDFLGGRIDNVIRPIIYYLLDSLTEHSAVLHMLVRYKCRTEAFKKDVLRPHVLAAGQNKEQVLEDDLRLYLFDQGLENALSQPKGETGNPDLVWLHDPNDPLVMEVKFMHKDSGYGTERIKAGLHQVQRYAAEHAKNVGYLCVFNLDPQFVRFDFAEAGGPLPYLDIENRRFYFLVINLHEVPSASKSSKVPEVLVARKELLGQ